MHPNWAAKSGKFDCSIMSLSVLLDYRLEDNKEHSFEVTQLCYLQLAILDSFKFLCEHFLIAESLIYGTIAI